MTDLQPIDTAPRDRPICLHGGGYFCGDTGDFVSVPAVAFWLHGVWAMPEVHAPQGYQQAEGWTEAPRRDATEGQV